MPRDGDLIPVSFAYAAASGDKTLAAAATGVKWALIQCTAGTDTDTNFRYYSGSSAGTALSGPLPVAARSGLVDGSHPDIPLAVSVAGEALVINSSAAITGGGHAAVCRWR